MLPHAPGVQMQAIPEDAVPDDTVDEDTEDPDKRLSSKTAFGFHTMSLRLHTARSDDVPIIMCLRQILLVAYL